MDNRLRRSDLEEPKLQGGIATIYKEEDGSGPSALSSVHCPGCHCHRQGQKQVIGV
jgi:hypothetical protein